MSENDEVEPKKEEPATASELPSETEDAPPSAVPPDPHAAPMTYPDDGPFAKGVRRFDNLVGKVEQVVLVATLAIVAIVATLAAVLDKVAGVHIEIKSEIVHTGTYGIAIFGAVFATHQSRHLAMDLISRRLSPKHRLVLKVILAMFACFIVGLMFKAGFQSIETERGLQQHDKLLTSAQIAWFIPIGSALIIFHFVLHTLIDIDYLRRGKTPPERQRSGH